MVMMGEVGVKLGRRGSDYNSAEGKRESRFLSSCGKNSF